MLQLILVALLAASAAFGQVPVAGPSLSGGASSLTTTGAIPYVTSAGVLGQDATALFWDATNDRLGVGTASPGSKVDIQNTVNTKAMQIVNSASATGVASLNIYSNVVHTGTSGNSVFAVEVQNASTTGTAFYVQQAGTGLGAVINGGNVVIGNSPTDGNYRLDVQASGTTGTLRAFDQGIAGSTLAVIQAGAGQSGNLLSVRNNGGTEMAWVTSGGNISSWGDIRAGSGGLFYWDTRSKVQSPSDGVIQLSNLSVTDFNRLQFGGTSASFPALKRSTTILQARLADDSANTQIQASRFISDQTTPSASTDACTAGAMWADATYAYFCTASGAVKRVTLVAF